MTERKVVVSGVGVVSPYGIGKELFWDNISEGRSAAQLIKSFDTSDLPTRFFAEVPLSEDQLESHIEDQKSTKTMSRISKLAMIAADEAVLEAGIDFGKIDPYDIGTSIGSGGLGYWDLGHTEKFLSIISNSNTERSNGQVSYREIWNNIIKYIHPLTPLKALPNIGTAHIAIKYGARGNCQTVTTACTSSTQAIGEAYRQIKHGYADVMITGGSDSLTNPNGLVAFSMLGVLSKNNNEYITAARPFDKRRDGFMIGEGASIFILEEYEHCKRRGGQPYAELIGYASTNDSYRLTDEPPEAWGSIKAIENTLKEAGNGLKKVDYINAHGTGTQMNDKNETFAIKSVFGEDAYGIPVSSTKSMIGHLVAAAGCIEFAACLLAMKHQVIPPTINYGVPDEDCDLDYVPNSSRDSKLNTILTNSFGFGGQNACLLIRRI